ncbi:MAG: FAD:protein FMN transferase [Candidatus Protistobacter heckmanni]|nr:FAD:protein FMN transferase [Candidatus Protistobacter heckmanni]
MLGTFLTIRAHESSTLTTEQLTSATNSTFRALERVERLMNFHRADSDIGRFNRARPGARLRVHRWTYTVLREALHLSQASDGAFDCNVGTVLARAGLLPRSGKAVAQCRQPMRKSISLTRDGRVRLMHRVSIDLGGIANGFAVDRAVRVLRDRGVRGGLVNAGGDLRVFGPDHQTVWVRCPNAPSEQRLIGHLRDGAVATSGSYFTCEASSDGMTASAIVDTACGQRLDLAGSVSVIAKTCMQADALTKIVAPRGRVPTELRWRSQAKVIKL